MRDTLAPMKGMVLAATVAVALVGSVFSDAAIAAPIVLDQQNTGQVARLNADTDRIIWQQGVTSGLTGKLTQFDINVVALQTDDQGHDLPVTGEIVVFVNLGAPWQSDAPEYETTIAVTAGWNSIVLPTPLFMLAGTQFTIGAHGVTDHPMPLVGLWSDGSFAYPGGRLFVTVDGQLDSFNSLDFRTYVDTGAVPMPEPTSLFLTIVAAVGVAVRNRRKQQVSLTTLTSRVPPTALKKPAS